MRKVHSLFIAALVLCILVALGAYGVGYRNGARAERAAWGLPIGDGVTDDTAAIERLVSGAACIGGRVTIPPGTYRLTP